jgi:hypothetical protein
MSVILSNITLPVNENYPEGTATANIGESMCPDNTLMVSSKVGTGSKVTITNKCTPFSIAENGRCTNNKQFITNSSLSPTLKNKVKDNICVDVFSSCGINSELDENNNCITYQIPIVTNVIRDKTTSSYWCISPGISFDNKCYNCKPGYTLDIEKKRCYKL